MAREEHGGVDFDSEWRAGGVEHNGSHFQYIRRGDETRSGRQDGWSVLTRVSSSQAGTKNGIHKKGDKKASDIQLL
jgi:hypothetical protein